LGFQVSYRGNGTEKSFPRYMIPMAGKPGGEVRLHITDLAFNPEEPITLSIKSVDSAGNVDAAFTQAKHLSSNFGGIKIPYSDL
jgi:hypothetical protein